MLRLLSAGSLRRPLRFGVRSPLGLTRALSAVQEHQQPFDDSKIPTAVTHKPPVSNSTTTTLIKRALPLVRGGSLPEVEINWKRYGNPKHPLVYIMPSMSHSAHVTSGGDPSEPAGWWEQIVNKGPGFGIDTSQFQVRTAFFWFFSRI